MNGTARPVRFFSQLLLILMGIVIVYLVVDFGRQVMDSHFLRAYLRELVAQLGVTDQEQEDLVDQYGYSQSEAAVDDWARRQGMVKENERSITITSDAEEPVSSVRESPVPAQASVSSRQVWWDLFFAQR